MVLMVALSTLCTWTFTMGLLRQVAWGHGLDAPGAKKSWWGLDVL